jgi:AcrR family transcriptional regulator
MKRTRKTAATRDPAQTRKDLLRAAMREFNTHGFAGTDTNRIARVAGYAPQTFYRHFDDKIAIFLAVYEDWWQAEVSALDASQSPAPASAKKAAEIAIDFHTRWRVFRRSLRLLSVEDARVRASRAQARQVQIARAKQRNPAKRSDAEWVALLLTSERLCDAVADGELADLGLNKSAALKLVTEAMRPLAGAGRDRSDVSTLAAAPAADRASS